MNPNMKFNLAALFLLVPRKLENQKVLGDYLQKKEKVKQSNFPLACASTEH